MRSLVCLLALAGFTTQSLGQQQQQPLYATAKPNVVFILTDDQDAQLGSLDYMPYVKKHLLDKGTHYRSHYCTTSVCCPSRVTLWTGKLAHNTNVTDVNPPHGGCTTNHHVYMRILLIHSQVVIQSLSLKVSMTTICLSGYRKPGTIPTTLVNCSTSTRSTIITPPSQLGLPET